MKIFATLLAYALLTTSSTVCASQPPPRKTLVERVEFATHVIVGTAKKVTVVEDNDGEIREVNPPPENIDPSTQAAMIEIEVEETIYPLGWKPKTTVKYFFGGGHFSVESIRKDVLNRKLIYLMQSYPYEDLKNDGDIFLPSYEWHLVEAVEKKEEIQAVLAARLKRETEAKTEKPYAK